MASDATLLIIDDHPLFVDGFASMLAVMRPQWRLVRASGVAAASVVLSGHERFDLAIVDIRLQDGDGLDLVARLAQSHPDLPALVASGRDDATTAARALQAGARGFIPKSETAEAILAVIERLLAGEHGIVGPIAAGPVDMPVLTERQRQVLDLLAQGCANKEIRHRLGIAERTVRAHLTELFAHLRVTGRVQALLRARDIGLIE